MSSSQSTAESGGMTMNEMNQPKGGIEVPTNQSDAEPAEHDRGLHGMEPDETVLALGQEERQARNPSEPVGQGAGHVLVEPDRGLFQVVRASPSVR